ncbi:MAG: YigZ family protein [Candidimonas sp.]|nr:YigZ family protein [Candidimonas sp.]
MSSTLTGLATHQEDIRKSRFVAVAMPVKTPAQALRFFADHSVADATHNCWAYRIGDDYRFNDDGEPGGTAGRPILQAIEGQQCDQVAVLVVRWFGGIKLGPGGLIRAYGGVAAQCLRLAPKVEIVDEIQVDCRCVFSDMALVQSRLAAFDARVVNESFDGSGVRWRLAVPRSQADALRETFINLTRGAGHWAPVETPPDAAREV